MPATYYLNNTDSGRRRVLSYEIGLKKTQHRPKTAVKKSLGPAKPLWVPLQRGDWYNGSV